MKNELSFDSEVTGYSVKWFTYIGVNPHRLCQGDIKGVMFRCYILAYVTDTSVIYRKQMMHTTDLYCSSFC